MPLFCTAINKNVSSLLRFLFSSSYLRCYFFHTFDFLIQVLADILPLGSEWHQITLGYQDSSQYSGICCNLNGLDSTADFQLFQLPLQTLGTVPCALSTTGITVNLWHRPSICLSFTFFDFYSDAPGRQNPLDDKFLLLFYSSGSFLHQN